MEKALTLRHYEEENDQVCLENYVLWDLSYTAHPKEKIKEVLEGAQLFPLVMCNEDNQIVGFFCLTRNWDTEHYSTNQQALLLSALSVDERYRGQGYGRAGISALAEFLAVEFPTRDEVVLAVNRQNILAQNLYLSLGFEDTGKRLTGPRGEQFVYRKGY